MADGQPPSGLATSRPTTSLPTFSGPVNSSPRTSPRTVTYGTLPRESPRTLAVPQARNETRSGTVSYSGSDDQLFPPRAKTDFSSKELIERSNDHTLGLEDLGKDIPVMLIPWLVFAVPLSTFGWMSQIAVSFIGLAYGIALSVIILLFSLRMGRRWIGFSVLCLVSSVSGFAVGWCMRSAAGGREAASRESWICASSILIYIVASVGVSSLLAELKCPLVGSSKTLTNEWRAVVVHHMNFGIDRHFQSGAELVEDHVHPRFVAEGLIKHRCYWSGEPALDYAFYVCNEHTFLGCAFCHPVNAFEKWERVLVLIIVCALIVFPVAFFSVAVAGTSLRVCLVLFLITVPRNILKMSLKKIVLKEDKRVLNIADSEEEEIEESRGESSDESASRDGQKARATSSQRNRCRISRAEDALRSEMKFFSVAFLFVFIVCGSCSVYVISQGRPLGKELWIACVGLVYAFVLELVFQLVIPHKEADANVGINGWSIGFFGAWEAQRRISGRAKRACDKQ